MSYYITVYDGEKPMVLRCGQKFYDYLVRELKNAH